MAACGIRTASVLTKFLKRQPARSESRHPDLPMENKLLVVVEAKFRSLNRSNKGKREDELRKSRPYIKHASRYLNREGAEEAVRDGWYELLRNWALGTALKEALGCPAFVLVNLLRKRHEKEHGENPRREFADRACLHSPNSRFCGRLIGKTWSLPHPRSATIPTQGCWSIGQGTNQNCWASPRSRSSIGGEGELSLLR